MAPATRNDTTLAKKIATLQLRLVPLVPLPSGPPHPEFPRTLMAFHLLTEDQLDGIAHYYHQSTPGPWTNHYPSNMNWDKEFLARRTAQSPTSTMHSTRTRRQSRQLSHGDNIWLEELMQTVEDLQTPVLAQQESNAANPYAGMSDQERIRIKRRKVGKFIGLVGMETPAEEVAGRIQANLDRIIERSQEALRQNEEITLRRRKMA